MICDMELDEKVRWKVLRDEILEGHRWLEKEGLYESPKIYVNGVAQNDGSWVKYVHNGKLWCRNKEEIGRYLYGYMCFLLKVQVDDNWELLQHVYQETKAVIQ